MKKYYYKKIIMNSIKNNFKYKIGDQFSYEGIREIDGKKYIKIDISTYEIIGITKTKYYDRIWEHFDIEIEEEEVLDEYIHIYLLKKIKGDGIKFDYKDFIFLKEDDI